MRPTRDPEQALIVHANRATTREHRPPALWGRLQSARRCQALAIARTCLIPESSRRRVLMPEQV